jgi:addiction module RelB/DinJ family antitoxin
MDLKTKRDAQKVLANLGMDASTAVKVLFKQIAITKSFPVDIRDENGFSPRAAKELMEAIKDAENSTEVFNSAEEVLEDALK